MNMKPTILLAVLASILAASSAAAISSADEVTLAEVLRKANILLDRLLARTEGSQSRNDQDFELQLDERYNPDKHRQSSSHVQTRNEDSPTTLERELNEEKKEWYWIPRRQAWVWRDTPPNVHVRPERGPADGEDFADGQWVRASKEDLEQISRQYPVRPEREASEDMSSQLVRATEEDLEQISRQYPVRPEREASEDGHVSNGPVPYVNRAAKNEDGPVPYISKKRLASSSSSASERGVYDQGMPEFNADRKGRDEHARGIYDEGLPEFHADDSPKYERGRGIYDDGLPEFHADGKNRVGKDVDEDPVDEMSLKEAIEWLRQLREQRRNHPA